MLCILSMASQTFAMEDTQPNFCFILADDCNQICSDATADGSQNAEHDQAIEQNAYQPCLL